MFKTFNQTSAEDMAGALDFAERPVMFDPAKKPIVLGFFDELGFKAIDNSRLLEPYGMLWIDQAPMRGAGAISHSCGFAANDPLTNCVSNC